ncbi:excinuclease ABC subunit C [Methanosarcina sp. KYL-1]|uniref:excinuclease ABC subunit UvrC n=1 Tax=Methanosarcina sp. KYL-1 TaxID=2602068 RepID=UPI002100C408|nr:excinuclease ABC subunit UvrC [Methanosarcina sp. KYL-1]MCQ1536528.1 excinuclease ABC subunit C [Methanosarcina sp. KYL-1]
MIDLESLPHLPGCYLFRDEEGIVLYVGKAKDLKKRVSSYFQKRNHDPKTASLVQAARGLDFIVTNTEVEALLLENTLIKKHWPRYNISLKDSKRYACIHITEEKFPRIRLARKKTEGGNFFGPFVSARERDYIYEVVRKTFQLRTCKNMPKRACLRYHITACSGPCIGNISEEEYGEKVKRAVSVLKGNIRELIESLEKDMRELAAKQQFEQAMELRDEIAALENLQEKQNVERQKKHDEDILNYIVRDDTVYLMLFKVYKGTLEDKQDYVFAFGEAFLEEFLVQYYSENEPPEELILPEPLDASLEEFLAHVKGKKVKVTVPKQGEKKELLDLAGKNVEIGFFGDRKKLEALQQKLSLPKLPNVIECFDISHLSGTSTVGSMVQFRGGRPDKHNYRRFKIQSVEGIDDFASIAEVVHRRYSRLLEDGHELPDLIIIDGGKGQLSAAFHELRKLNLRVPIISIAKREEEIYVPGLKAPLPIKKDEKASLFVQEIRDEAHRFAITYNRLLRQKSLLT